MRRDASRHDAELTTHVHPEHGLLVRKVIFESRAAGPRIAGAACGLALPGRYESSRFEDPDSRDKSARTFGARSRMWGRAESLSAVVGKLAGEPAAPDPVTMLPALKAMGPGWRPFRCVGKGSRHFPTATLSSSAGRGRLAPTPWRGGSTSECKAFQGRTSSGGCDSMLARSPGRGSDIEPRSAPSAVVPAPWPMRRGAIVAGQQVRVALRQIRNKRCRDRGGHDEAALQSARKLLHREAVCRRPDQPRPPRVDESWIAWLP